MKLYRIIGNAVSIPLGAALARSVGQAAVIDWRQGKLEKKTPAHKILDPRRDFPGRPYILLDRMPSVSKAGTPRR